jgi:hypothetical protein
VAGVAVAATAIAVPARPSFAASPARAAWWARTNANGITTPPPPDAGNGLFVEGTPAGPAAIAALWFDLPARAVTGNLVLHVTSTVGMRNGLSACPLSAPMPFTSVQNGAWADAPAYDCTTAARGTLDTAGTTVTFPSAGLVRARVLAVAIVPSGTDRAAFAMPADDALAVSVPDEPVVAAATVEPASTQPSDVFFPAAGPAIAFPEAAPTSTPAVAGPPARPTPTAAVAPVTTAKHHPWRHTAAVVVGMALLIGALVFYTQGHGLLGARIADR